MKKLTIALVIHTKKLSYTTALILKTINELGYRSLTVDPCRVAVDEAGNFFTTHRDTVRILRFDAVIARAHFWEFSDSLDEKIRTAYVNFLQACKTRRIPTINGEPFLVDICQNKFFSHVVLKKILRKHGIKNPFTYFISNKALFDRLIKHLAFPLVIKNPLGALGRDIYVVNTAAGARRRLHHLSFPLIFQEIIHKKKNQHGEFQDLRIIVSRNPHTEKPMILSVVWRNNADFVTNISHGGYYTLQDVKQDFIACAKDILTKLKADVLAIDFALDEQGRRVFFEINYDPGTGKEFVDLQGNIWSNVIQLVVERYQRYQKKIKTRSLLST